VPKSPAAESPQKNLTGPPRVIRDIIADLHNTIQNWNSQHINGCTLVKQISSWKANETKFYSPELEELTTQLSVVVSALRINCDTLNLIQSQAEAFTKLPGLQNPVFFSLSAQDMSRLISDICRAYNGEIKVCLCMFSYFFWKSLFGFRQSSLYWKIYHIQKEKMKQCFWQLIGHINCILVTKLL